MVNPICDMRKRKIRQHAADVASPGNSSDARAQAEQKGKQRRDRNHQQDKSRPQPRRQRGHQPSNDQCQKHRRRRKRATQVVDHFPSADRRDGVRAAFVRRYPAFPEDPRQQLPVASRPSVLPGGCGLIVRRKLFEQLDVRCQGRAGKEPFEQVVAQQRVVQNFACQGLFKRVDIINSFSGIGTFPE